MFDATKLLGTVFEDRAAPSAQRRLDAAVREGGLAAPGGPLSALLGGGGGGAAGSGGLAGMLGSLLGGGGAAGAQGQGGSQGGFADLLRQAAGQPGTALRQNNPMAVGGLGALAGLLFGGGRGAVGGGLLAALGSLAYTAMQRAGEAPDAGTGAGTGAGADGTAAGARSPTREAVAGMVPPEFRQSAATPEAKPPAADALGFEDEAEVQRAATLALRAMISAAKADGRIDEAEIERIAGRLDEAEPEARDFVREEMRRPLDLEGLAAAARTPKEAAQVYAASLMAIEVDSNAERDYLARLAAALGLSPPVVEFLHRSTGVRA